jgi:hypothetical protein
MLGHAHADLLSFDLSLGDRRLVTDTGTSVYDPGAERQQLRSTAAHNTVQINGAEQIEAWGSFRVGRRGRARVVGTGSDGPWTWIWASHDAYRWLPGRPTHARLLALCETAVVVLDSVTGNSRYQVTNRLHLHPDSPDTLDRVVALGGELVRATAPYHGRFGETREMIRLEVTATAEFRWVGGWLILCGGPAMRGEFGEVECDVRWIDDSVRLRCTGGFELDATWRLSAASQPSGAVSLCSPERESAT